MQKKLMLALLGIVLLASLSFFGCTAQPENTGISAKPAGGGIEISWNPSQKADVTGYNLYRSTSSGALGSKINPVLITTTKYTDTSVTHGAAYYYIVRSVSSSGTEDTNTFQASATADLSPPTDLQIQINGGAQYANSKSVTLALSATNANECRLSNDGSSWSVWQPYAVSAPWQLSDGDGPKTVYYECRDSSGNSEYPATASIYLDMNGPSISISSPQSGTTYGTPVQLSFTVTDPISTTVTCGGTLDSGAIAIGKTDTGKLDTLSVSVQPGTHTISVTCNDGVNTATQSVSFSVATDQPSVYLHIENGAGYVSGTGVTLDVTATNADQCRFANENMAWKDWAYYNSKVGWVLSAGDGLKTVYAQCKSASGQMSATVSDSVELYSKPPTSYISVEIDNGDDWTNTREVRLGLYCYGAYQCRYRNENDDWSGYGSYTTGKSWTLSSGEGDKKVYYNCMDTNSRDLGTASSTIYYSEKQHTAPSSMSVKINGGATETTDADVSLTLRATNADACRVSNEVGSWSSWKSYTTRMDWTLTSGAGRKTVYYECRNDYGTTDASASIYLDNSPPGPINNLRASVDRHGDVHLTWSRPSGDVYRYNVYRSNTAFGMFAKVGTTSTTTYADYSLASGTYAYYVKAVDSAGNEGDPSNTVDAEIPGGSIEPGGDTDEHGCKNSAGYTWCEPLQECIKAWETECSSRSSEPSIGGSTDDHGCSTDGGYTWCESSQTCIRPWEDECP